MTKTLSKQQAKTRTCVMAWKALMEQAQADLPYKAFPTSAAWWSAVTAPRADCWPVQAARDCRGLLPCR